MSKTTTWAGLPFMQLDVYRVARELVVRVGRLGLRDAELRTQASRAASSVLLNLAEGLASREGARRRHLDIARGSVFEVAAAVDASAALALTTEADASEVIALCSRVSAMLYRMR